MKPDANLEWNELGQVNSEKPVWFWEDDHGLYCVHSNPWRISGPDHVHINIPDAIWIDRLFILKSGVFLADWRSQKVWVFHSQPPALSEMKLPEALDVTALFETAAGDFWLLNRSHSQLVYMTSEGVVKRRLGTRLGVSSEKRLGFEWPNDALFSHDGRHVLLADSGNNRLVRLDTQTDSFFPMSLPIHPAFILYDGPEGWLISDGVNDLLWGSDQVGPTRHHSGQKMQCCRILRYDEKMYGADETGLWGEILVKKPNATIESEIPLARLLLQLEKNEMDLSTLLSGVDLDSLRELLRYNPKKRILLEYLVQGDFLLEYQPDPWSGLDELEVDAKTLHDLASGKVGEINSESSMVERTVLGYHIRKRYWNLIDAVRKWRLLLEQLSQQTSLPDSLLKMNECVAEEARLRIRQVASELRDQTSDLHSEVLLTMMVRYSLARGVLVELGQNLGSDRILVFHRGLVGAIEAIDILAADIYLQKGDIARFKTGYEQAILDHPKLTSLPMNYINKLFDIGDLDGIEKRLAAMTNRQQEHLNARLARLYRQRGNMAKAVMHLRKELDLFPNRLELIILLLEITDVDDAELEKRLSRALVGRQGQIDTHNNVGKIYLNRGQTEKALDHFFSECELFPENQYPLLQIKDLLFSRPELKKKMGKAQTIRLWMVLRSHIVARKPGLPLSDGIIPLLFILNELSLEDVDPAWLRGTLSYITNSEWFCEIDSWLEWQSVKGHAIEHFLRHPDSLPDWLEQMSCREALAQEIMSTKPSARQDLLSLVKQRYPEALPSLDNRRPLHLEDNNLLLGMRRPFKFTRAQIVDGSVFYTLEDDCRLMASPEMDINNHRPVWTFSGGGQPLCVNHQRLRTVLLWDEEARVLKEINYQGEVLAMAPFDNRPRWLLFKDDGYYVFKNETNRVVWNNWLTSEGFCEPFQELLAPPDKMYGMAYDLGLGLCRGADNRFFSFSKGEFTPLFKFDSSRLVLKAAYYWGAYDLFAVLQGYKGLTNTYLTLVGMNGEIRQRIPLLVSHVNWLGFGEKNQLFVGQLGHWLAGMEYEMTL